MSHMKCISESFSNRFIAISFFVIINRSSAEYSTLSLIELVSLVLSFSFLGILFIIIIISDIKSPNNIINVGNIK